MALSPTKQEPCCLADDASERHLDEDVLRRSKSYQAHVASKEDTVRKIAIALAAVAVVTVGSTLSASAMHGGGGMGHGGMGHGGMGHGGMGHGGMSGFGHAGGFGAMARPGGFAGVVHPMGMRRGHVVVGDRFHFRHRFVRNRFAFIGVGVPYGYYDDCYVRVWTPWGWRWNYVCY
jgi:hypothetical protein